MKSQSKAVSILLRLAAGLLATLLGFMLVFTVLVMDIRIITEKSTIKKITQNVADAIIAAPAREGEARLSSKPEKTKSLADVILDEVRKRTKSDPTVEQIQNFLDNSTVSDYVADKSADFISDYIQGKDNTNITAAEIDALIEENKELLEETFDFTVDDKFIQGARDAAVNNVNDFIKEDVFDKVDRTAITGSFTVGDALGSLRGMISTPMLVLYIFICVALMVGIFFCKRMQIGSTLITVGVPFLSTGIALVAVNLILPMLTGLLPKISGVHKIVGVLLSAIAPVHYTVLILGVVFLVAGIVLNIVLRPKTATA